MKRPGFAWIAAVLLAAIVPTLARGQSPEALLRRVAERADARVQAVNDYTVELGGLDTRVTLYTSRRSPSAPFDVQFAGEGVLGQAATALAWADIFVLGLQDRRLRSRTPARLVYTGLAQVDGTPVHVVTATLRGSRSEDGSIPRSFAVSYDTVTLLPRQVEWATELPGGSMVRTTVEYLDYRFVQGVPVAHRRRTVMRGMRAAMSEAQVALLRRTVEGMRAELHRQSEAEQVRGRQVIEMAEGLLDRDEQVSEVTVTEAVVNEGIPNGVPLRRLAPPVP